MGEMFTAEKVGGENVGAGGADVGGPDFTGKIGIFCQPSLSYRYLSSPRLQRAGAVRRCVSAHASLPFRYHFIVAGACTVRLGVVD